MKKSIITIAATLLLLQFLFFASTSKALSAEKKGEGIILESSGEAKIIDSGKTKKIFSLQPVFAGNVIVTGKTGTINFASYKDHNEYKLNPNSRVSFSKDSFKVESGSIEKKTGGNELPIPQNTTLVSRRIMGHPVRVFREEVVIKNPKRNMVFANTDITFEWEGGINDNYYIEIAKDEQQSCPKPFPISVKGNKYSPDRRNPPIKLEYGKTYTFRIWEIQADEETKSNKNNNQIKAAVTFSILPQKQAQVVQKAEMTYNKKTSGNLVEKKVILLMADCYKENKMFYQAASLLEHMKEMDRNNPYILIFLSEMYLKTYDNRAGQTMEEANKILEQQE